MVSHGSFCISEQTKLLFRFVRYIKADFKLDSGLEYGLEDHDFHIQVQQTAEWEPLNISLNPVAICIFHLKLMVSECELTRGLKGHTAADQTDDDNMRSFQGKIVQSHRQLWRQILLLLLAELRRTVADRNELARSVADSDEGWVRFKFIAMNIAREQATECVSMISSISQAHAKNTEIFDPEVVKELERISKGGGLAILPVDNIATSSDHVAAEVQAPLAGESHL